MYDRKSADNVKATWRKRYPCPNYELDWFVSADQHLLSHLLFRKLLQASYRTFWSIHKSLTKQMWECLTDFKIVLRQHWKRASWSQFRVWEVRNSWKQFPLFKACVIFSFEGSQPTGNTTLPTQHYRSPLMSLYFVLAQNLTTTFLISNFILALTKCNRKNITSKRQSCLQVYFHKHFCPTDCSKCWL